MKGIKAKVHFKKKADKFRLPVFHVYRTISSQVFYSDGHYEQMDSLRSLSRDQFKLVSVSHHLITYVWKEKYLVWEFSRRVSHVISEITGEYEE